MNTATDKKINRPLVISLGLLFLIFSLAIHKEHSLRKKGLIGSEDLLHSSSNDASLRN